MIFVVQVYISGSCGEKKLESNSRMQMFIVANSGKKLVYVIYNIFDLQRVVLFRKTVLKDKEVLGVLESTRVSPQSTLITVHRSRLIEVIL